MKKTQPKTEKAFLENYDASLYEKPSAAVDIVILTIKSNKLQALIIKRDDYPFKHKWSLIGGFIDINKDQTLEQTAKRKLREKTGVKAPYLEQVITVGNKKRDPRGWSISTVYFALLPYEKVSLQLGTGAADIKWGPCEGDSIKEKLAFDHADLLAVCLDRLRSKVVYTSLPVYLHSENFTLSELQATYEIIMGKPIEKKSFYRRMLASGILEETNEMRKSGRRPAKLYRLVNNKEAHYFTRIIG